MKPMPVTALKGASASRGAEGGGPGVGGGEAEREDWAPMMIVAAADGVMAFSSNGVFHPASLLFIDWFLCHASRVPVCQPPAIDKLRVLQAMTMSAAIAAAFNT